MRAVGAARGAIVPAAGDAPDSGGGVIGANVTPDGIRIATSGQAANQHPAEQRTMARATPYMNVRGIHVAVAGTSSTSARTMISQRMNAQQYLTVWS
jgi:uncharacterized Zn-binding protein involved in type VI secretion